MIYVVPKLDMIVVFAAEQNRRKSLTQPITTEQGIAVSS